MKAVVGWTCECCCHEDETEVNLEQTLRAFIHERMKESPKGFAMFIHIDPELIDQV